MLKRLAMLCAVAGLAVGGCNKQKEGGSGTATTGPSNSNGTLHLAFVTNNASDFWTIARAGTQKAQQETPNIQVDFQIPSDGTAAGQKRIVEDLLTRGVDGMAISPVDPANETSLLNGAAKQTLLFTQDSDAPNSNRACYVGTNNEAAGKQAGELVKKAIPNGGKIMVFVGKADAQNARDRYNGLKAALAGSNISIIDLRTDDVDHVRAKANALDTLVTYPDVAGLVGLWSYNGPAILSAVRESKKAGQVKIVCFDEEDATLGSAQRRRLCHGRAAAVRVRPPVHGTNDQGPPRGQVGDSRGQADLHPHAGHPEGQRGRVPDEAEQTPRPVSGRLPFHVFGDPGTSRHLQALPRRGGAE